MSRNLNTETQRHREEPVLSVPLCLCGENSKPRLSRVAIGAGVFAALLLMSGCAATRPPLLTPPEPPMVWPKSPDQPRLRYLGEITASSDVRPAKSLGTVLDELVHGPTPPSHLVSPHAVAVHEDGIRIAIADTSAGCVHWFDIEQQQYQRIASVGNAAEQFDRPGAVCWAGDELWIADAGRPGIARWNHTTPAANQSPWIGLDTLKRPAGLAYCSTNRLVYVADAGLHRIVVFDLGGRQVLEFGSQGSGPGQFNFPTQLACHGQELVVVDTLNFRIQRLALDGTPIGSFGRKGDAAGDLSLPKGVAVAPDGSIWVVDANFENVQAFAADGRLLMAFGQEGHAPGEFWLPAGACIDTRRRLWIADSFNRRVQVFGLLE